MNYRHAYHAGNFGDVLKHVLLVALFRALQQKEKGFLYLDTHAGRGAYDLEPASRGDSFARKPEWPNGIGRLWAATDLPPPVADYVGWVKTYDRDAGNLTGQVRFYPGSPVIARILARPQDRLALCERHPEEHAALREVMNVGNRGIHQMDGYEALRAMLPPPEKRALILVDPPYEEADEAERLVAGVADVLRRLPGATLAIWYPLTPRMRPEVFFRRLIELKPPPTLAAELTIAGEASGLKLRGCALTILNPPWKFDAIARETVHCLAKVLAQDPGGEGNVSWVIPEL